MSNTMRAARIHKFGGIDQIMIDTCAIPEPKSGEVQIKTVAAGVNPVDWKIAEGHLKNRIDYAFPITLGWDIAGTVSKVGDGVTKFRPGDPVFSYCRQEIIHAGSFAEYLCLDAQNVTRKPKNLSFEEAAVIPLAVLTAWQSVYNFMHIAEGQTVLIHAGAGGVGGFAIQLAKLKGAHVISTASEKNRDYVEMLGADLVIDYHKQRFLDVIQSDYPDGVDGAFDTVGRETLRHSYDVVKRGGKLVTITDAVDVDIALKRQIEAAFVFVTPDEDELEQISALFEEEKLVPPRVQTFPFKHVIEALETNRARHVQGKLALTFD